MDNNNQDQQRKQALQETLERAGAFEELVRSKGWEWLTAYYQAALQELSNNLMLSDAKIEGFEERRQQLKGMRELFGVVSSDLEQLQRYRKEQDGRQAATASQE